MFIQPTMHGNVENHLRVELVEMISPLESL